MIDAFAAIRSAYNVTIPESHRRPIGVIGAGWIVENAHLPAYLAADLPVAGIYDRDLSVAAATAQTFGIPRVYANLDELCEDPVVEVVDIAIPATEQPAVARRAISAGKHLLCQKPFALSEAKARDVVEAADAAQVKLAVNQQLRYEETVFATRRVIEMGWLGTPLQVSVTLSGLMDWTIWPWMSDLGHIELPYHSIHYLDTIRYLIGEPDLVWGIGGGAPGRIAPRAATSTLTMMRFGRDGPRAYVDANHDVTRGGGDSVLRVDGTEGSARASLAWPGPGSLHVSSPRLGEGWVAYAPTHSWRPDAFVGPMKSLLSSIAEGGEPMPSGRDNLRTLALVDALQRAMDTGESQPVGVPDGPVL
jgi:predicted dehydrogenase